MSNYSVSEYTMLVEPLLNERDDSPLFDSEGKPILVGRHPNGDAYLIGAWFKVGDPFIKDCHGQYVRGADGERIFFIRTPPGREFLEQERIEREKLLAQPFRDPTPRQHEEMVRAMQVSWYLTGRDKYFNGRRMDSTVLPHASRCGDLDFLQWAIDSGAAADPWTEFDLKHIRGYAVSYGHDHIVSWCDALSIN